MGGFCNGVAQPLGFNPNPHSLGKELLPLFFFPPCRIFHIWDALVTSCDVRAGGAYSEG